MLPEILALATAMPSNAFYSSLNDFCRRYFVVGPRPLTLAEQQQFPAHNIAEQAALFEHLVTGYGGVTVTVHSIHSWGYGDSAFNSLGLR
jgi:hypothetical protein